MASPLYKVLVDGRFCHGVDMAWSLPSGDKPGEWHEEAEATLCRRGLHLTDSPAHWWKPGCAVYLVEAEGVVGDSATGDRKCVARRVRLMREATREELRALHIYLDGEVDAGALSAGAVVIASGSATVRASGSATVRAYDSATVRAYDSATVEAYDSATVEAYDSATVVSWWGSSAIKLIAKSHAVHVDRRNGKPVVEVANG